MNRRTLLIAALVAAIAYYYVSSRADASDVEGGWIVYGTMSCGWTKKQIDYMKQQGIPHKFVNCDSGACKGMKAFPVVESPNGERSVGYTEI